MAFNVPMAFVPMQQLRRLAKPFFSFAKGMEKGLPNLSVDLMRAEVEYTSREYIAMSMAAACINFVFLFIFCFFMTKMGLSIVMGLLISGFLSLILFFQKLAYPKMYSNARIKSIERNLLPAMQNILIQLNAGVPLFNILVSIAQGGYGGVSKEFEKAIREMNAGRSQVTTLDDLASRNPSPYFRRAIWQLTNGIKTGSDLASVIQDGISSLAEYQIIQIEKYGGQLKPLAMFYLLIAVIMPSLGTTFIILLASFVAVSDFGIKMIFWSLFTVVVFFQLMFMGIIKGKRPNLLE
ncbi:MAG: type II secretion system F family protein [Nanoarchaeota archaeon]|nr:type II secretion system F family protein [Nanoarchaeota archaeon]